MNIMSIASEQMKSQQTDFQELNNYDIAITKDRCVLLVASEGETDITDTGLASSLLELFGENRA